MKHILAFSILLVAIHSQSNSSTEHEECHKMNCFDCGFNHRECQWTLLPGGAGACEPKSSTRLTHNKKWFQYFAQCRDTKNTCRSNHLDLTHKIEGSNFAQALNQGEEAYFTMEPEMRSKVPRNYFCAWSVVLDPFKYYTLEIVRKTGQVRSEYLSLKIHGI